MAWLQVFGGDGFVEVGVGEVLLLSFQLVVALVGEQCLVAFVSGVEFSAGELVDFVNRLGGELDGRAPDAFDFVLDFLNRDVWQVAAGALVWWPRQKKY